ncbi:MAG: hypothetical protein BroJett030_22330 [Alphaproteobacteria bacterium]|nr:MAG: hypothetical protein BroJett030_22330 [Alphaproteobacteria bacterium]
MNQGPNRVFDEFAKLMTDAAGAAQGLRREVETAFRAQAERFLADMDLVKRDEFDAIKEMAANARAENEALKARIEALEARIAALSPKK